MDNYSAFIQDDWRLGSSFVLNLGLRYDYYGVVQVRPTTEVSKSRSSTTRTPTDINKLDFGPLRDPLKPYDPDSMNFGPRAGFAWTLNDDETTVIRGGVGYMYSPNLIATVRQSVANPFIPFRIIYLDLRSKPETSTGQYIRTTRRYLRCGMPAASEACSRSSTPTCRRPIRFSRCSACSIR